VVGAAVIAPGVVWLAVLEPLTATGRVVELSCVAGGGCTQTLVQGEPVPDRPVTSMFMGSNGRLWAGTFDDCVLEWNVRTATVSSRTCDAPSGRPFSADTIDGPQTATSTSDELFATFDGMPVRYAGGAIEHIPIQGSADLSMWIGPGEGVFVSNARNVVATTSPPIWHRLPDGTVQKEAPIGGEFLQLISGARMMPGLGPMIAAYPIGRQVQDLLVRTSSGWSVYASTAIVDHTIQCLAPFRGGVLFGGSAGKVGQVWNRSACSLVYALSYDFSGRFMLDLRLGDESFLAAGSPNIVYRLVPNNTP
jgi:hypothetical protein